VKAITIISFDLRKAFDLVPHHLLIHKLSQFLPTNILSLIDNYLSRRTQKVQVQNSYSAELRVPSGVSQGAILSPFLFNAFFNDLQFTPETKLYKYADDVTLIIPHENNSITSNINTKIEQMSFWCKNNHLQLNCSKTQIMTIKKSNNISLHPLHSTHIKILGVIFNEKLKWSMQIHEIVKKASQRLYILYNLKRHLSKKELLIIYKAIIQSILSYAGELYVILPQSLESHLNKVIKRCHKVICHPHCHCHLIESPNNQSVFSKK